MQADCVTGISLLFELNKNLFVLLLSLKAEVVRGDGMSLYDVIESSNTPIEVICTGKIMSMGVIVALGAEVRKAYRNTTFMIHQLSGLSFGTLREMEDSVAEASRINEMLFNIIKSKTLVTEEQLNEVLQQKKDWFLTAEEALRLGILTDII